MNSKVLEDQMAEVRKFRQAIEAEKHPKKRMKIGRSLANRCGGIAQLEAELDIATIEEAIDGLKLARKVHAQTDYMNKDMALLTKRRLDAMGCSDAPVLAEKRKKVSVDSGCLSAACSAPIDPDVWTGPANIVVESMNRGEFFLINMGSDGDYSVSLRIVDAPEPVLKPEEYKKLELSTEPGYIRNTAGQLLFGAPEYLENAAVVKVASEHLSVQAYLLETSRYRYRIILVACATEEPPAPLLQIPELRDFA